MQRKTIQRIITNKLEDWLSSISDEELRNKVKANILLSGGSITSLFQNIEVNDYDIYIKDPDVLSSLIMYYSNLVGGVTILDGRYKERLVEEILNAYDVSEIKDVNNSFAISVRNLKENQIKLFFESGDDKGGKKCEKPTDENAKYYPVFMSPNAISLSDDIQIVTRFYGDNVEIHKTFDFVHATNYFTFDTGLVTNLAAVESILTKQLGYQGSLYPLTSIIRMKKFTNRGWSINAGEMLKMMFQVSELNLKDPDVLEEQLIGVDVAYFGTLIEVLRGVPSEKLTSAYLNTIIDKVFSNDEREN